MPDDWCEYPFISIFTPNYGRRSSQFLNMPRTVAPGMKLSEV
jgi:hypothetical protein